MGGCHCSLAAIAFEATAKSPGSGAGVDDVSLVGDLVDDRLCEPWVGEHLGPVTERKVGGHDQAAAFVAFRDDLQDELGGTPGRGSG